MKSKETESVASFLLMVIALFIGISFMYAFFFQDNAEIETTNAKPIYQQRIGDEAEPDILIIYEAEVDGVKVYPSVIKEAE